MNIKNSLVMKWLHKLEDFIIISATAVIIIMTVVNVLMRYVFYSAIIWSDELIGFGMLVIGLVGTATCVRDKLNTSLDGLMCRLPRKLQTIAYFAVNIVVVALLIYFCIAGFSFLGTIGNQKSAMLKWPMVYFYGLIPVCCVLYVVETIATVIDDIYNCNCRFIPIEEQFTSNSIDRKEEKQ